MSNEVVISAGLIEECLVEGYQTPYLLRVVSGPDSEAKIVGVRWEVNEQGPESRSVVLIYDRDVPDAVLLQSLIGEHPGEIGTGFV